MHSVEVRTGRLIEMRIGAPLPIEEVNEIVRKVMPLFIGRSEKMLVIVDLRGLRVMSPEATEAFLAIMKRDNPLIERSAYLVNADAGVLGMQVERILREAQNPSRRVIRDAAEAMRWLGEKLTAAEAARVSSFLELD